MIWCEPSYMKQFHCIADKCSDTCCAGWEIVLDEDAIERYEQTEGSFGKRLLQEIKRDGEEAYFALTREKRCPFLDEHNLCEIYQELGEDALCDICTEHPRFYNWVGDYTEKGLGLCCEEAERLLFAEQAPVYLEIHQDGDGEEMSDDLKVLLQIRAEAMSVLQDREMALEERMQEFLTYMESVQLALEGKEDELSEGEYSEEELAESDISDNEPFEASAHESDINGSEVCESEIQESEISGTESYEKMRANMTYENAQELFTVFRKLDYLDQRFVEILKNAQENCANILTHGLNLLREDKERLYEWEHVAVYFLYRYMTEAVYDSDVLTRSRLVAVCLKVLALLAGRIALTDGYTEKKRDELLRMFSREIEYCPENMEAVFEAIREGRIS